MTLQQISYIIAVSKAGSMNKAAQSLFISQPALTNAIKELEEEIGCSIFIRTGKGVIATKEGKEFLTYARQLYQQFELINHKFIESKSIKRKFGVSMQHYSFAVQAFVDTVKEYDTSKYELFLRETKTLEVIEDVGNFKSEIGVLYLNKFNEKVIKHYLTKHDCEFHNLVKCQAYVYIYKNHPCAKQKSISFEDLKPYPCLSFEQGDESSFYFAEEILSTNEYERTIKTTDRATMLNLMVGLNGYTLCSGIISEELNGSDYITVPFKSDDENNNEVMQIGYILKKKSRLSEIGKLYIEKMKKYFKDSGIEVDE